MEVLGQEIESVSQFFVGWWQSAKYPLTFVIYLTLLYLGVKTVISHFRIHSHLKKIEDGIIEIDIMDAYDESDVQSFVERYFNKYRISHKNKPLLSLLEFNKMVVSLLIIIGVLGTFFSLVLSFDDIDEAFSSNSNIPVTESSESSDGDIPANEIISADTFNDIGDTLKKMSIAFYTSILGMVLSIILSIISKTYNNELLLDRIMLQYEVLLEKKLNEKVAKSKAEEEEIKYTLQKEAYSSINDMRDAILVIGNSLSSFADFSKEISSTAKNLKNLNKDLDQSVGKYDQMFKMMENTIGNYEKGLDDMNTNFRNLFTYFGQIDEEKRQYNNLLEKQNETNVQQFNILHNIGKSIDVALLSAEVRNNKLIELNSGLVSRLETIHQENISSINDLYERVNLHSERLHANLYQSSEKMHQDNISQMENFNQHIFNKNNELFNDINALQNSMNKRSEELDHLRQEIIENANNGFISNLNEFDHKIDIFNSRLEKVVDRIDAGLEINIEKALRNFADYVKFTQEILDKKLTAITKVVSIYEKSGEHHLEELFHSITEFNDNLVEIAYLLKDSSMNGKSNTSLSISNR